jgi:hypothetical protein
VHSLEHSASLIPFFLLSNLDVIGLEGQNADNKKANSREMLPLIGMGRRRWSN